MAQVLLIEDDAAIRPSLLRALRDRGYAVRRPRTGMDGLPRPSRTGPTWSCSTSACPTSTAPQVLSMLRAVSDVPVIVATARDDEPSSSRVLDAGADDYVVKPFTTAQLEARVRAVLRRRRAAAAGAQHRRRRTRDRRPLGGPRLDGAALDLTPREFDLLHDLAEPAGRGGHQAGADDRGVAEPYGGADKTVDVHLSWLRRKLGETASEPRYLHTVRGVGVRLARRRF